MKIIKLIALLYLLLVCAHLADAEEKVTVRFGHFPNITHAQGVVAHALSRQGKGWFEQRLGPNVEIQWFTYNAGPSAMEAIFAGSLDLTYLGQGPALNAHLKSNGEEIRILAGAANGGAALVVRSDGPLKNAADFRGKKIATPQLGNTQDISCRAWLKAQGFKVTQTGADVMVLPTANPDQLALFQSGGVDAVWTVEPWVTRLERDAKAKPLGMAHLGTQLLRPCAACSSVILSELFLAFPLDYSPRAGIYSAIRSEQWRWDCKPCPASAGFHLRFCGSAKPKQQCCLSS